MYSLVVLIICITFRVISSNAQDSESEYLTLNSCCSVQNSFQNGECRPEGSKFPSDLDKLDIFVANVSNLQSAEDNSLQIR